MSENISVQEQVSPGWGACYRAMCCSSYGQMICLAVEQRKDEVMGVKKRALVVGGSNGIGLSIVHQLLQRVESISLIETCG